MKTKRPNRPEKTPPGRAELMAQVAYCLANAPGQFAVRRLRDLASETKRPSKKRPAEVHLSVQDEVVMALRNPPLHGPEVLLVVIPRDTCDAWAEQAEADRRHEETGIILPGERIR